MHIFALRKREKMEHCDRNGGKRGFFVFFMSAMLWLIHNFDGVTNCVQFVSMPDYVGQHLPPKSFRI